MTIRKERGKFVVRSQSGKKLGSHSSRRAAERQLRAVEASKRKGSK